RPRQPARRLHRSPAARPGAGAGRHLPAQHLVHPTVHLHDRHPAVASVRHRGESDMSTPIRSSATARVGGGLIAAVVIGALAVFFASDSLLSLFAQATIFAILALGVGVLLRQNGLVSFGHAAFYGVAGYVIGILMNNLGWSPEVAVIAAILGVS